MKILMLLSLIYPHLSTSSRILAFFPFPEVTHLSVVEPIIHGLAEKGHNLTYISRYNLKSHNYKVTEIIIDDFKENSTKPTLEKYVPSFVLTILDNLGFVVRNTLDEGILGLQNNEEIYSTIVFKTLMETNERYDLILFESIFNQEPQSALMHKFQAIGVDIQAQGDDSWINEITGLPSNPSFMVDYKTSFTNQMDFWDRFQNTFFINTAVIVHYLMLEYIAEKQMDKHFVYPGSQCRPPLRTLVKDKALILANTHFSIGYSYPKSPNVREIGGINIIRSKQLPNNIKYFMDAAKHGVIYINIELRNSSDNFTDLLLEEFNKMPQKFIWKRKDDYTIESSDVIFSKRLPQNDILFHKNTKVFITNGGYLDIIASVYNAVPLIGIPKTGPELKNIMKISTEGCGIMIHPMDLTPSKLIKAIKHILNNHSYAANVGEKSTIFRDRRSPPLDEAVYWIEYVLRNKNALKPVSTHMDYLRLHNLDVEFLFFTLLTFLFFLVRLIYLCIFPKREKQNKKQ